MFFQQEAQAAKFKRDFKTVVRRLYDECEPVSLDGLLLDETSSELQTELSKVEASQLFPVHTYAKTT